MAPELSYGLLVERLPTELVQDRVIVVPDNHSGPPEALILPLLQVADTCLNGRSCLEQVLQVVLEEKRHGAAVGMTANVHLIPPDGILLPELLDQGPEEVLLHWVVVAPALAAWNGHVRIHHDEASGRPLRNIVESTCLLNGLWRIVAAMEHDYDRHWPPRIRGDNGGPVNCGVPAIDLQQPPLRQGSWSSPWQAVICQVLKEA
mmetsp:Transcript_120524/g.336275  ORF Transcript_120524/g.336275 Transcript_120524/m.336275 type:complete len:204 (+) Transcript_120524:458-1069(+)